MLMKTITKNPAFVIFLIAVAGLCAACSSAVSSSTGNENTARKNDAATWNAPRVVGTIKSGEITESSGLVASKCQPNVFWTHNDSGDDAFVFALDDKGEKLGTFKITNAKNRDWEDIGTFKTGGDCYLYLGDIGNNTRLRGEAIIYRVAEPKVSAADKTSDVKNPAPTEAAQIIKIEYPDVRHDAETLFVHPTTGDVYILTKRLSGASGVYKLAANYDLTKINRLEKIADFTVPAIPNGFLTGGDISADGRRVVVCDYFDAYEITLPPDAKNFDEIWKQTPTVIHLGKREQGEAVAYSTDGAAIYATSEKENSPFIKVERSKR